MDRIDLKDLLAALRENAAKTVWNRAVDWAKQATLRLEEEGGRELSLQFTHPRLKGPVRVDFWLDQMDGTCSCSDPDSPCVHLVAAAIVLNQQGAAPIESAPRVLHTFERRGRALSFDRFVVIGEKRQRISEPLSMFMGGIRSGRIDLPAFMVLQEELAVDAALGMKKHGLLDAQTLRLLIPALSRVPHVSLDGRPVRCRAALLEEELRLVVEGDRFRFRWGSEAGASERFDEGIVRLDDDLAILHRPVLQPAERAIIGRSEPLSFEELAQFVSLHLPGLMRKLEVRWPKGAPQPVELSPEVVFQMDSLPGGDLMVKPKLVYGDPILAEVERGQLRLVQKRSIPLRDLEAEREIAMAVREQDYLMVGESRRFEGAAAVAAAGRLSERRCVGSTDGELSLLGTLDAEARFEAGGLGLRFKVEGAGGSVFANPAEVIRAWRAGAAVVPLLDRAGLAKLPKDWLAKHGAALAELLQAKQAEGTNPALLRVIEARLGDELGAEVPAELANLERALSSRQGLAEASLPDDFDGALRAYQSQGVAWLQALQRHGLGGILADDMGLGKTMQALCVLEAPALVIAPTSVLFSWREHLERYRPALSVNEYHGPRRMLNDAGVTITSYAILRLDADALAAKRWKCVVLDEAHVIKNADSQVARAAFRLEADFRLSLTGTPLENRALDLWSQSHFANPGALGSRAQFEERYGGAAPEAGALAELSARIRPFLLRRVKEEVLSELPEKTEVVLTCELSDEERELYDLLRAAARSELLSELAAGRNTLAALELLLRLRQACCHSGLIPGKHDVSGSSKVRLLLEELEQSLDNGHRALIFSQWTSLLDRVEPALGERGISWSRLDGATADREGVVKEFQDPAGPSVMLVSLKAGGLGLTLTAADHVYILDPWWNPAVEDQASSRAHRIGQANPVLIHRLVARDTVEERILLLQEAKRSLSREIIGRGGAAELLTQSISREELLELLS